MGVPVVSLAGDRFMARMGFMLLGAVGLGALAQSDPAAFAAAADLAGAPARRATLRRTLRARRCATRPAVPASSNAPIAPCGGAGACGSR
jgi:predicted O-linked N-acetylglucosamine transferase (SPINDLY family)